MNSQPSAIFNNSFVGNAAGMRSRLRGLHWVFAVIVGATMLFASQEASAVCYPGCSVGDCYMDRDGDGYGATPTCGYDADCRCDGGLLSYYGGDCNDADPSINPNETETCNGVDDDCGGGVDEGLTRSCGDGTGYCSTGTRTCSNGNWGSCVGDRGPRSESCNGVDDDCDGSTDESLTRSCGDGTGYCSPGTEICSNGNWGSCQGYQGPRSESCNNIDDNCNGSVDEGVVRTCGSNVGVCSTGVEYCSSGNWGTCEGDDPGGTETCNGQDDDCDGSADEDFANKGGSCSEGVGACRDGGTFVCSADGSGTTCSATPSSPSAEICNGIDDNCDGQVDENLTRSCGQSTGMCQTGTETCSNGNWGACQGGVTPQTETCNGSDDNCDGTTDEGCDCLNGETRACGSDVGVCAEGTQTCESGQWAVCEGAVSAGVETCNGLDDNCDGSVDEGVKTVFYADADSDGYGDSNDTTEACTVPPGYVAAAGDCALDDGSIYPGAAEVCNAVDDDCSGAVDDMVTDCTGLEICQDGQCVAPCETSADCAPGATCFEGVCYPGCSGDQDCPGDLACREGACVELTCDEVGCDDGQTCYRSVCYPECSQEVICSDADSVCFAQACVPPEDCAVDGCEAPDAGAGDAGLSDAGNGSDIGVDADDERELPGQVLTGDGGCGCTSASGPVPAVPLGLLAVAGVGMGLARRRRRR
jgi:MYXO-CTERM domain-containing protein